jgi:GT2 family glycosyltransferase
MTPLLSIIICTLNREEVLCNTLRSVIAIVKERSDTELIVVDQTQIHDITTRRYLEALAETIQLHRVDFASLTRARNYGVRHARGEIILFLDDDVEPSSQLVAAHLACYVAPEVWGVGGCTLLPGKSKMSKGDFTQEYLLSLERDAAYRFDLDWSRRISWAPGCNMSFRRERLFEVGGFDESFYGIAVGEEAELCYRINKAGGILEYSPMAELIHLVNPSGGCRLATESLEKTAQLLDNQYYYLKRIDKDWVYIWSALISQCRSIALNRRTLNDGTWLKWTTICIRGILRVFQNGRREPVLGLLNSAEKKNILL